MKRLDEPTERQVQDGSPRAAESPPTLTPTPPAQEDVKSAAALWLTEHGDYLFSYAVARVRRREAAEDLVQETLLAAMESFGRFEQRSSTRTWLTSILRHKLADHWRSRGRDSKDGVHAQAEFAVGESALERIAESQFKKSGKWASNPTRWSRSSNPVELLESEEFRRALLDCIDKLPSRPAEAIDLVERGGMNLEQLSNLLGITTTYAGVILHRARLALRECLEKNWFRKE